MSSKKEYSIRKVTMVATGILIGIAASSLGTAYAQEDNNIKPTVEMKHNENTTTIKPDMSKEHNELSSSKEVAPKSVEKLENITSKEDEILGEIIKEKFDWNTIDEKNFLNYLLSDIKADKSREREIKELWLVKINQLLITHADNENLIKIKAILEKDLASDNKKEGKDSEEKKDKKEQEKESDRKESEKELKKEDSPQGKDSEEKKDKKESEKELKKEDSPQGKDSEEKKDKKEQEKELKKEDSPQGKDSEEKKDKKESEKESNKKEESTEKKDKDVVNNTVVANKVLPAKLLGRDVTVSFNKDKIDADEVFVGAVKDETLNNEIIKKLGNDYKIIEVFEIHFKKAGEKVDSEEERTVKVSVMKKDDTELEVYHIADNNVLTKIKDVSFSSGLLQFKINHFSKFAILERIRVGVKGLESRAQIVVPAELDKKEDTKNSSNNSDLDNQNSDKKVENNKKETEELPKTGLESEQTIVMSLLALIAAIVIRKKQEQ